MSAVVLRARTDLRNRAGSWLVIALIVGLLGGIVTAIAAGARRTESAYPRFLADQRSPDLGIVTASSDTGFAQLTTAQVTHLPDVADAGSVVGYLVGSPAVVNLVAPVDSHIGRSILRKRIIAGRDVNPRHVDEATISFVLAEHEHLRVGDRLRLRLAQPGPDGSVEVVPISLHVVGIDVTPLEFPPQIGTATDTAWTTVAFTRAHPHLSSVAMTVIRVRDPHRSIPVVEAALRRASHGAPTRTWRVASSDSNTQRSINLQVVALWILAALLGLATLLVVGQLLSRQSALEADEHPVLRGLGMTRGELWLVGMTRAVAIGVVGAVIAVVVAIALSPIMPIGLAREAEPNPGISFDAVALAAGAAGTLLLVLLAMAGPAARDARVARRGRRRARPVAAPASPAPLALGVRFATDTSSDAVPVPIRTTVLCGAVGVVALVTAFGFAASLNHLLATPRLYGVNWDAEVSGTTTSVLTPALRVVERTPGVEAIAEGYVGFPVNIGRTQVDAMALRTYRGSSVLGTPVHGRIPERSGEIMLGSATASAVHAHVGSTITARLVNGAPERLRVVGVGAFPTLSDSLGLGKGAATTTSTLLATLPKGASPPPPDTMLLRFAPTADRAREIADLEHHLDASFAVLPAEKPVDLVNFGRVQNLPSVLAGLLAMLAALTLAHLLITSVRRRSRDFAMLRALGFTSGQLSGTVAVLATTLVALALVVGIPAGLILAHVLWQLFAHNLGIVARPAMPVGAIAAVAPIALVAANVVAYAAARRARRIEPATALHTE